jgi:hypothetical protein|tara:strand:- start:394 stop:813 length:420 start_codon:yes stop_codon:yes gene_type:complete
MRYYKSKRSRFRSNDKGFRRNDSQDAKIGGINKILNNYQQNKSFGRGRNGHSAERLLEKYNSLAREALSNGDKILSESYYQHADHFLRVIEKRNAFQNNSKPHLDNSLPIEENSNDKIILKDEKVLHLDKHKIVKKSEN